MVEVKAYICSYCGGRLTTNYNDMIEHEKRCYKNPHKKFCACSLCVHSERKSYETTNRWGEPISKGYSECTIGCEFDEFYRYCESFEYDEKYK